MPESYVDEAIVLNRINYGESDRILTLLTKEHGKVGVIARGARKPNSKFSSHTDLFVHSKVQLVKGKGSLLTLTQAERMGKLPDFQQTVGTICGAVAAEVIAVSLEDGQPLDDGLFDLILDSFEKLFNAKTNSRAELIWFIQHYFQILGYAIQLYECVNCGNPLPPEAAVFVSSLGGLVCGSCSRGTTNGIICGLTTIKVLRLIQSGNHEMYQKLKMDEGLLENLEQVMSEEFRYYLERSLKSWGVYSSFLHPKYS